MLLGETRSKGEAMMENLVKYEAMCRAITECHEVDEVKEIRDKALALEVYARQVVDTEAERQACEIRMRAERRAGGPLRQKKNASGTRGRTVAKTRWKN